MLIESAGIGNLNPLYTEGRKKTERKGIARGEGVKKSL